MHIAASNPIALESSLFVQSVVDKELELVTEELKNLGKSEDIAQNVFMKIWKKKIDTTKGNIKSLLFKMGTDEFISYYRRSKIEREYVNSQDFKLVQQDDDDDFSEKKKMYEKALKALTDKQRVALLMNKLEGLTYKEIAESFRN